MIDKFDFRRELFDSQGHRGCRGLMPENSVPGFKKAIDLKVNTLEMDIAISMDKKVVVSHEPWLNTNICIIQEEKKKKGEMEIAYNLYRMEYAEIALYDCGSRSYSKFPLQMKISTNKPLLEEVIKEVEAYSKSKSINPLSYNIEIKYKEEGENLFHPVREEFLDLFYHVIMENNVVKRTTLQCFDIGILQLARQKYPGLKLVLLVDNKKGVQWNIKALGFNPDVYSPEYKLLSRGDIMFLKQEGILVIPWTINKEEHIEKMILMGADGIISDYPDRVEKVIAKFGTKQFLK